MKKSLLIFACLLFALSLQAQNGTEKSIADMEHQWAAASKASNPDAIAPMLADSFMELDSDGVMHTRAEVLARVKGTKWEVNEIGDVKVTVSGNTAIATGSWQGKGVDSSGKSVDQKERWLDTWVKTAGGKWQCVATASAPVKM